MASVIGCQGVSYGKLHSVPDQYAVDRSELAALREARGLSMTAFARKAGVDYSSYWRIEKGRAHNPRIETIQRLAHALDVPVERLIAAGPAAPEPASAKMHPAESLARLFGSGTLTPAAATSRPDAARPTALLIGPLGDIEGLRDLEPEEEASVRAAMAMIRARRADRGGHGC